MHRSKNLAEIQADVVAWANEVLPNRDVSSMLIKLMEEMGEVAKNPSDALQLADILILLVDIADNYDIDLTQAVDNRMHINRIRRWNKNRHTGVMERQDG